MLDFFVLLREERLMPQKAKDVSKISFSFANANIFFVSFLMVNMIYIQLYVFTYFDTYMCSAFWVLLLSSMQFFFSFLFLFLFTCFFFHSWIFFCCVDKWNGTQYDCSLGRNLNFQGTRFSMEQFRRLFNCSRIPGQGADSLYTRWKTSELR